MGLCFPMSKVATWVGTRPNTMFSASTTCQDRTMAGSDGNWVFIRQTISVKLAQTLMVADYGGSVNRLWQLVCWGRNPNAIPDCRNRPTTDMTVRLAGKFRQRSFVFLWL